MRYTCARRLSDFDVSFSPSGIDDWANVFGDRLKTFLGVLRECEDTAMLQGRLGSDPERRLSEHMRRSWESEESWVAYAVLYSLALMLFTGARLMRERVGHHRLAHPVSLDDLLSCTYLGSTISTPRDLSRDSSRPTTPPWPERSHLPLGCLARGGLEQTLPTSLLRPSPYRNDQCIMYYLPRDARTWK